MTATEVEKEVLVKPTEELIRNQIKALFDDGSNDPVYQAYSNIDKNISSDILTSEHQINTTRVTTLRISEFFNTLYFFESINDTIRDAYLNHHHLRRGLLTNGALFKTNKAKSAVSIGYTMDELAVLAQKKPQLYQHILEELKTQLGVDETNCSEEEWYFWPGCEMKIPLKTTILLDTSVSKSKFVITKKVQRSNNTELSQIILEEKPYQLEVSLLGENDFLYDKKQSGNYQKLDPGFFTINTSEPSFNGINAKNDFKEVGLTLQKGETYEYTLYVPYSSPRFDIQTHLKIYNSDETVEEFIATCT
ncbi:hypothetical protein [Aquimarina longa]|uniref:hypothetical protein n=1 Tax=Aquimarina longa TaxID=1080221 RepID=UPI000782DCEF|nr:hypothetical protein [Aquimarina longa]